MASVIRGSDNFDSAAGAAMKAWVNFNGTGTVAIRADYNVSSITDNGTGLYTINFTTAFSDTNYAFVGTARKWDTGTAGYELTVSAWSNSVKTTSALYVYSAQAPTTKTDSPEINVVAFR